MAEPDTLRLARQVHRLRTLGLGIGVLPIMAVLYEHGASLPAGFGTARYVNAEP